MTTRERTDYDYLAVAEKMDYRPLTAEDVILLAPFYTLRPNRSCDSAPLDQYLYRNFYQVKYCQVEDALFLMFMDGSEEADPDGTAKSVTPEIYGFLPYCREEDLAH